MFPNRNKPNKNNFKPLVFPTPKAGLRVAVVSLIVDLGTQKRKDLYKLGDKLVTKDTPGAVSHPQDPCQQVLIAIDLTRDVVSYGETIGDKPYRHVLNRTSKNEESGETELEGINYTFSYPKDANGNKIKGRKPELHPQNMISKLCDAVGMKDVKVTGQLQNLLNQKCCVEIEIVEKTREGDDGKPVVSKYVKQKGFSSVPMVEDENGNEVPQKVPPLPYTAHCVTFENATLEMVREFRKAWIDKIKLAEEYEGSNMQKAIEALEAEREGKQEQKQENTAFPATGAEDFDDDVPF